MSVDDDEPWIEDVTIDQIAAELVLQRMDKMFEGVVDKAIKQRMMFTHT